MAKKINFQKEVWEGWTVGAFISSLEVQLDMIMSGNSWKRPFGSKAELKAWCKDEQPGYKKHIPDVVNYFAQKYNLK